MTEAGAAGVRAVVFDLLYTLVHPGVFPGGGDRESWLAGLLGVDEQLLVKRWEEFEPRLESGRAPHTGPLGPELEWISATAEALGRPISPEALVTVEEGWDLTRRRALADPPGSTVTTLRTLRGADLRIGVLSNTHALEIRSWPASPLAGMVNAVSFSHEIGCMKPAAAAYEHILGQLGVTAGETWYVGDGGSDELSGARAAGFDLVVLAAEAPARMNPELLPALTDQADVVVQRLDEIPKLLNAV